jgi:hypothetical protein
MGKQEVTEELGVKKNPIWKIPPAMIFIENPNVREYYDPEKKAILKASIKENGVLLPVRVRKVQGEDRYALTHGFTRMECVWELVEEGCEILYVKAESVIINEEEELIQHLTLNSGEPLTKYEISKLLVKLKGYGWSNKTMSQKTGYPETIISQLLSFQQNASNNVKESVAKGEIDMAPAMSMVKEHKTVEKQNEVLQKGKEQAAKTGKKKVTGKQVLSKRLSQWDKYTQVMEIIDGDKNAYRGNMDLVNIEKFFFLLNDGKSTPEEILKKYLAK